jgi:hypothetical protein
VQFVLVALVLRSGEDELIFEKRSVHSSFCHFIGGYVAESVSTVKPVGVQTIEQTRKLRLKMSSWSQSLVTISLVSLVSISLLGCDQLSSRIFPKSSEQVLGEARQALAANNPQKVIEITKPFLKKTDNGSEQIIYLAAQAYSNVGDVENVIGLLDVLVNRRFIEKTQLINESDFANLRTDIRFISWVANVGSADSNLKSEVVPADLSSTVSAEIGANGISARAGNVSVKISN